MLYIQTVLAFLVWQSVSLEAEKSSKKYSKTSTVYKTLEKDVKKLKANNIKCKQSSFASIMRLKCQEKLDEALVCIAGKLLNGNSVDGELWTVLGQVYNSRGETSKGAKCFKEASKISGELAARITMWHFLGPFQIGKPEVDGDPVEVLGGIQKVSCQRHNESFTAYSELVNGGEIRWSRVKPDKNGVVSVSPLREFQWQTLVMSLQSVAVREWQGWLIGDFYVNNEMTMFIQCLGVHTIYINENILVGDVYNRNQYWYPLHIKPGVHSVMLKARANEHLQFSCNLKSSDSSPLFEIHKPLTPDVVDGYIFSDIISVPVTNYSPTKWLKITTVTLLTQNSGLAISLSLGKSQRTLYAIAPGQLRDITLHFKYKDDQRKPKGNVDISGVLQLGTSDGKYGDMSFLIRCRKRTESFVFTFIDHDGSVQHAAAIFPIVKNKPTSTHIYPVLLTLHGTGVSVQNQADSYKRKEKDIWVFGVEGLWTLAPTRHGAHNWQGPGELTSMTALRRLAELTMVNEWVSYKANSEAVVFAGHSMGGHGAWQLSTHHPDIALAVISMAGWITKEDYGDSNVFFKHDISVSHTDGRTKYIMEACVSENDVDKHVPNLKGIPVMIRVGAKDRTVSPYFSRRMYRLLKEQGNNVTYTEIPDKEHWWWDTYNTNDGGVVNDPQVRNFAIKYSKYARRQLSSACSKNQDDESCMEESTTRYRPDDKENRNQAASGQFTLTVYNPASTNGVRGVRILQQSSPFTKSVVEINISEKNVTLITTNVVRLRLTEPAISPVHWHSKLIFIDHVEFAVDNKHGREIEVCLEDFENWKACPDAGESFESELQRGPVNLGPARRVAESPLLIVVGHSRDDNTNRALLQLAVYIANLFYLTSGAFVPVLREKQAINGNLRDNNLIILGETSENSLIFPYLEKSPLSFQKDDSIRLRRCVFRSLNMGALFLAPHSGSRLALIITGTSLLGIRDVIHLATPTIPPMARSPFSNLVPDYVITGPEFRARGPGGYICAGFWGNQWEYRNDLSSCSC